MKVAFIVLTWNDIENTTVTVSCLLTQSITNYKIYVVDNDSAPEISIGLMKYCQTDSRLIYVHNDRNTGYAGGNNLGISRAMIDDPDYYFIINNDVFFIQRDLVKNMIIAAETNSHIGILGPCVFNKGSGGIFTKTPVSRFHRIMIEKILTVPAFENSLFVSRPGVMGCFMLITRRCLRDIGDFNESFFMYGEEVDLAYRAIIKKYYVGEAKLSGCIYHLGGSFDMSGAPLWKLSLLSRNTMLISRRFGTVHGTIYFFYALAFMLSVAVGKKMNLGHRCAILRGLGCGICDIVLKRDDLHILRQAHGLVSSLA